MALMRFSSMSIATSRTLVPTDTETTSLLMMSSAVEGVSMTAGRPVLELGALDLTIAISPHPDSAACCASSLRWAPDIERRRYISTGGVTEIGGRLIQREPGGWMRTPPGR